MTELARNSLVVLAAFMLVGGIFGFVKAKSKASLISGVVSSALLCACFGVAFSYMRAGLIGGLVVATLLDVVFAIRLQKTKKFMPSGMLLIINVIIQVIIVLGLVGGGATPAVTG